MYPSLRFCLLPVVAAALVACGGSDSSAPPEPVACNETGPYACKTGETEPLYTFQWALNYAKSFFRDFPDTFGGGLDLNVEPVHREGIKGEGVNVLVVDTGVDLHNEDLAPNADFGISRNLVTDTSDPYPVGDDPDDAHGTAVAGIIAAAQNGKGVMGIAPRVKIGGVNFLQNQRGTHAASLGGAPWSEKADIFNASYGGSRRPAAYESEADAFTPILRSMKKLRGGKGGIYMKAAGNAFDGQYCGLNHGYYDCTNPGNDEGAREPNAIVVAAVNAFGEASSYSSSGAVVWVSGLGGEYGAAGTYGEARYNDYSGPTIFSTDLRGCDAGFSRKGARTAFLRGESQRGGVPDNPRCDYAYMNGTSAATPTLSGVVALMLSANPELTWRDVRDILRLSARKVDASYASASPGEKIPYGARMDLASNTLGTSMGSAADIREGSVAVPIDLGWQKNAAGAEHSNWYGFGLPDAARAVALAKEYRQNPQRSRKQDVQTPEFEGVAVWQLKPDSNPAQVDAGQPTRVGAFPYQRVSLIGTLQGGAQTVDTFQVRLYGQNVCLGSVGVAVRSPSGTVSLLKLPNDHFRFYGVDRFAHFGLSSMTFHGEPAQGQWQIFALAGNPDGPLPPDVTHELPDGSTEVEEAAACLSTDAQGQPRDFLFAAEARIIAQ
ncbi:S8 family serine peptidase [Melaminivora sp.]|uniref:S8 family serine peptidase n=1 Tax=Melaminivora sp. TaxID=1933032 RepID=UPI0028B10ADF|nr:S8 family serine peptidase [Melaminivora sp.]